MAEKGQDAVSLLMADHRKVEGLFEQFEKASGAEKKRLGELGARPMERQLLDKFTSEGLPPPVTRTVKGRPPKKGPPPAFACK